MSRPRNWWYSNVVRTIRQYKKGLKEDTPQNIIARNAIKGAIDNLERKENGEDALKVVTLLYINSSHNVAGAAMQCFISESTAKRYARDFVNDVAERMGY